MSDATMSSHGAEVPASAREETPRKAKEPAKPPLPQRARAWTRAHPRGTVAIAVAVACAIVAAVLVVLHMRKYQSTDDAQVDGDISAISARVSGTVTAVYVVDNQPVKAGDVLAELDPADLRVAVAQAEANVALAKAQSQAQTPSVPITATSTKTSIATTGGDVATAAAELAAAEQDAASAKARLAEADAKNKLAQTDRARSQQLLDSGAVPRQDLDEKSAAADAAAAELKAAQAAVDAAGKRVDQQKARVGQAQSHLAEVRANAPKQLDIEKANVDSREASIKAAEAALDQAKLNLSYARIVAPVDGIVGKKSVNVGDHVQPGEQLVAIVQTGHLWVTANFKETQLDRMVPGQPVSIDVDAFGQTFDGEVESLPGASGARYSLFPPENATGNFVKVVQRLPVRIRFLPNQAGLDRLRPGMSVEPKVKVR